MSANVQNALVVEQDQLLDGPDKITISWHVDDVMAQAQKDDVEITRVQAIAVLLLLKQFHDANYGITWDDVRAGISTVTAYQDQALVDGPGRITISWHVDDVMAQAQIDGVEITREQAIDVLRNLKQHHDANYGITLGHVSAAISTVMDRDQNNSSSHVMRMD